MTWIDRIENTTFTIRTGDGREFYPQLPIGYDTAKDFNAATFEYINVPGAEIARKQVKARNFPLTFFFTGEDNIDDSDAFDQSANDPRAWIVRHPVYGDITGQPLSIRRSTNLNATQFNIDFWETIVTKNPVAALAPLIIAQQFYIEYNFISPIDYESKVSLKPADVSTIRSNADTINNLILKGLDAIHYAEYKQKQAAMFVAIDNLINQPVDAIRTIHEVIVSPYQFVLGVETRINLFVGIYNGISLLLEQAPTPNNKAYFETAGGVSIIGMALSMLNPLPTDYTTRLQVNNVAINLANLYNNYLTVLDAAYVRIGTPGMAFSASQQTQNVLQNMVLQTLAGLNTIAFNAKVERVVMLETDSQLIVLTHKYMGLDNLDQNIEIFRTINNIKNNNVFLIPKGSEIKYYA